MSGESLTYIIKKDPYGKNVVCRNKEESDLKLLCFKQDITAAKNFEPRNPKSITLGNEIEKSCHIIHTEKTKTKSVSMKHAEGGWPESIKDYTEPREINGWRRHKERDDVDFPQKVKTLIGLTTSIVNQNLRMDVYEEYFDNAEVAKVNEDNFSAKIKTVFKDTEKYKRSVSKIEFSADEDQSRIAVAYRINKGQEIEPNYKFPCLVWDLNNPNVPEKVLTCNSEITTLGFHPKLHNILGAGCANGMAVIFDLNTQKILATTKSDEYTHSEAICDFVWLKSNKSVEFVTTSTDGKAIWWEVKGINANPPVPITIENEKPSLILLDKGAESDKEYGGIKIEYNPEAGSTKFLFGTEQGIIFLANKKKNDSDISGFGLKSGRHLGPVLGLKRCPAYLKFFLTVGDWTARIWAEDFKTPIMTSKFHPAYLTDCVWCARTGLYIVSRSDGWINAYDLCYKINECAFAYKVCDSTILSISLNAKGDKLVVGDEEGKVYLIKLSKSFYSQQDFDKKKNYINTLFDRETLREKDLNKKKPIVNKDDNSKTLRLEQIIKEKVRSIDENYAVMLNEILQKTNFSKGIKEEGKEEVKKPEKIVVPQPQPEKEEILVKKESEKKEVNSSKISNRSEVQNSPVKENLNESKKNADVNNLSKEELKVDQSMDKDANASKFESEKQNESRLVENQVDQSMNKTEDNNYEEYEQVAPEENNNKEEIQNNDSANVDQMEENEVENKEEEK